MKLLPAVILSTTMVVLGNQLAWSQSATQDFFNPTLTDRNGTRLNIAGCVGSDRYSNVCGEDARRVVALEFCKLKGYSTWTEFRVVDLGWENRKFQWAWHDQDQGNGNFREDQSSFMFDYIQCSM